MTRKQKDPLRPLTDNERTYLEKVCRTHTESSHRASRAKILLEVAQNKSYKEAALSAGRRSALAVSQLVSRFNRESLKALDLLHGGGPDVIYGEDYKQKILSIVSSPPDRKNDGTATWSLTALQRHLKKNECHVSTYTIWKILHDAGYTHQKDRTWIKTGIVNRKRGGKVVEVVDPDMEAKKN
jgi:transposase